MVMITLPLTFRDLIAADLPACEWAGGARHLENMARQLERRPVIDYLAACPPSDLPIAKAGINYEAAPGTGTIWQVAVHPALQGCGIGTALMHEVEHRILRRGIDVARLTVEHNNPRARALYERLGYAAHGDEAQSWQTDKGLYETVCTIMLKPLA